MLLMFYGKKRVEFLSVLRELPLTIILFDLKKYILFEYGGLILTLAAEMRTVRAGNHNMPKYGRFTGLDR